MEVHDQNVFFHKYPHAREVVNVRTTPSNLGLWARNFPMCFYTERVNECWRICLNPDYERDIEDQKPFYKPGSTLTKTPPPPVRKRTSPRPQVSESHTEHSADPFRDGLGPRSRSRSPRGQYRNTAHSAPQAGDGHDPFQDTSSFPEPDTYPHGNVAHSHPQVAYSQNWYTYQNAD